MLMTIKRFVYRFHLERRSSAQKAFYRVKYSASDREIATGANDVVANFECYQTIPNHDEKSTWQSRFGMNNILEDVRGNRQSIRLFRVRL
jgi:hypothetical protein